ncbi:MAG: hypothetical protein D4R64_00920 [Porphyromonadaceae bacterium]|nr:MAG: hypothetical protein D4R64_00920 [Porphyromonadaceae bacterium]
MEQPRYNYISFLMIISLLYLIVECTNDVTPPSAFFEVSSKLAFTGRIVTFNAIASTDPDGDALTLKLRWDFNEDGQWDTNFSTNRIANWIFMESGRKRVWLEVQDQDGLTDQYSDTILIFKPNLDSFFVDTRDRQQYRAVKLNGNWWMAENLRYGIRIPSSEPQTDNGIAEFFAYDDNPSNIDIHGGLYSWEEMMDYHYEEVNDGICPEGWRVPTVEDWETINLIAPLQFILDYYGPDGMSGFNLQYSGFHFSHYQYSPYKPGFVNKGAEGVYWDTHWRFKYIENKIIKLYGIASFYNKSTSNAIGFPLTECGDYYLFTINNDIVYNTVSASLRCIKKK